MNQENLKKGYILLYRSVMDNDFYKERREFSKFEAWLDILFGVNHTDSRCLIGSTFFECKRGQALYSLDTWRERWGWQSKRKVRDFFLLLESKSMIGYENMSKTIRITVLNYDFYQSYGGVNSDNSERVSVHVPSDTRTTFRSEVVAKVEHLNTTKPTTYKGSQNASKTQAVRKQNASGTHTKRKQNQVSNSSNLSNSSNENVCELDTQKVKILETEIQQLRNDWKVLREESVGLEQKIQFVLVRVNNLNKGPEANGMDRNEFFGHHQAASKSYNDLVSVYNEKIALLQSMEDLAMFKKTEIGCIQSKGQYSLFSESPIADKAYFISKLAEMLRSSGVLLGDKELAQYYERAKAYSASKNMKSADWVSEVSGWVAKDRGKLKKVV